MKLNVLLTTEENKLCQQNDFWAEHTLNHMRQYYYENKQNHLPNIGTAPQKQSIYRMNNYQNIEIETIDKLDRPVLCF